MLSDEQGSLIPMSRIQSDRDRPFYAQTYDASVPDWPGEIDFYRELASTAKSAGQAVLELACGTGRVAIRLAESGAKVVGLDLSAAMLAVAREKSRGTSGIRWVEGDMRSFDLGETFGLVIIPGHAFQNLVTPEDQVHCLQSIRRHLAPQGVLVIHLDHQNVGWLGDLRKGKGGVFEEAEQFRHPATGRLIRTSRAWSYEPATQTAIAQTVWEEIDAQGDVVDRHESGPIRLHCVFRFEMEHLFRLAGYKVENVWGDFTGGELHDESEGMVWVARPRDGESLPLHE
jgi:SAM-dependent methyltransferase